MKDILNTAKAEKASNSGIVLIGKKEDSERMGFQKDKYFDGTEFERKSDCAPRMKAMDLSHSWWVQYQEKAISDMKMKEYQKLMKCYNNCENVLLNARACAEAVIANMRKEGKENCDISHPTGSENQVRRHNTVEDYRPQKIWMEGQKGKGKREKKETKLITHSHQSTLVMDTSKIPGPPPPTFHTSEWILISQGAEARVWKIPNFLSTGPCTLTAICKERFSKSYRHPRLDESLTKSRTKAEARSLCRCRRGGVSVPIVLGVDVPKTTNIEKIDDGSKKDSVASACLFLELVKGNTLREFLTIAEQITQEPGKGKLSEEPTRKKARLNDEKTSAVIHKTRLDEYAIKTAYATGATIAKMHNANIIHGDLTTSNIMIRNPPGRLDDIKTWEPDVVLIDFGLSSSSTNAGNKKNNVGSSCHEERGVDLYVLERAFGTTHPGSEPLVKEVLRAYKGLCSSSDSVLQRLTQVKMRGRKRECFG